MKPYWLLILLIVLALSGEMGRNASAQFDNSDLLRGMSPAASQHFTRGLKYFEQGKYTEAIQSFQHALIQQPSFPPANYYLATLYVKLGQAGKAISYYKNAIQDAPDFAEAHYGLASAYRELEEFDQAVSEYQKAIELAPDYADAYQDLGVA